MREAGRLFLSFFMLFVVNCNSDLKVACSKPIVDKQFNF